MNTDVNSSEYVSKLEANLEANIKNKENEVSSIKYLNWIESFTQKCNCDNANMPIQYNSKLSAEDKKYYKLLPTFQNFLIKIAHMQGICVYDVGGVFINFLYNNQFYTIRTFIEQVPETTLTILTHTPKEYVILGRQLNEDEKKKRQLYHYIIVKENLSLESKVDAIADISTLLTLKYGKSELYCIWKEFFNMQQKIITSSRIESNLLYNRLYVKENNTVVCESLGIVKGDKE